MTVIQDAPKRKPATKTEIQPASTATSRAASAMITTAKVRAFATDNPALCRVQQLSKREEGEGEQLVEVCNTLDGPFRAIAESAENTGDDNLILGPALLVPE
ncbi:hypothetical protein JG687_00012567 [Phytophthora cactorum]|uniref:Uncharacterized protein n=1 Tax=Phytophthora cactorum TaxID=29920 RepID=A0A329RME3_9STRA|nr:hypothetical protein Pcac1_g12310 [Phytophthora cactorum]KAG2809055.1 hypothetical protein PC112_g16672 [Phytophthora cactorum]KAG2881459.1 hypothetical protein PC114_g21547 [Phytophthora cactorum]KAG2913360.1 hypothetical protein PC115_g12075 [Phytophthora cactorum]KAG2958547.1 hypothetical protein PC118_g23472 [Phytophthora cactorum]